MRKLLVLLSISSFIVLLACTGSKGDSCDEEGHVGGECDEGLVCAKAKSETEGDLVCLKQCTNQLECSDGEDCDTVVKTNLKACRPR